MGEFESRSAKTRDAGEGFHLLENSHKLCQGFHQARKAQRTCLYNYIIISFIKLLFFNLTKGKTIYMYELHHFMYNFISFMKLFTNSHNLETANIIAHVISCLTNEIANTIQIVIII